MLKTVALVLPLAASAPRLAPAPALPALAAPSAFAAAPLAAPALAAPAAVPALAAAPAAAPSLPAAAPAAPGPDFASALQTQGWLLGVLARRAGQEPMVLSLGMSMAGDGMTVGDWAAVLRGLTDEQASPAEAEEALLRATARTPFARPLGPDNRPDLGDWSVLKMQLMELGREVSILRNNRFIGWTDDLAAGRPTPAFAPDPEVRDRGDGTWRVRLGWLDRGGAAEPLVVTVMAEAGKSPSLAYFLDPVFASPRLDPGMRAALDAVARTLADAGVRVASPR